MRDEIERLPSDAELVRLLAWRFVKARADAGGFDGRLLGDFAHARVTFEEMLDPKAVAASMREDPVRLPGLPRTSPGS